MNVISEVNGQIYANQVLAAEQKYCQLTYPSIGGIVAEGWNLPRVLADVIKYHHSPLESKDNERLTIVVYIGNIIAQLVLDVLVFDINVFDQEIISHIGLDEKDLSDMFYDIKEEAGQLEDLESFFK